MTKRSEKIEVENINTPGRSGRVDKRKYTAMRDALLEVLPCEAPGITVAEAREKLLPLLPQDVFPDGAKAGWWLKTVQLDLEAKLRVKREPTKPLKLYRLK